jgi:hypothetical protein
VRVTLSHCYSDTVEEILKESNDEDDEMRVDEAKSDLIEEEINTLLPKPDPAEAMDHTINTVLLAAEPVDDAYFYKQKVCGKTE